MVFLCCHYLANTLTRIIGLYRDHGLAILKNTRGPAAEELNQKFQKLFKEKDLGIIVQCNLKITNYLDITLNLNDRSYHPYRKPNEETNYIHINSDHPPSIIKRNSTSNWKKTLNFVIIKKYFSRVSCLLWKTSKNSGYKTKLQYQQPKENNQNKKRKKNVILFGSIHHTASELKPISVEYSSN